METLECYRFVEDDLTSANGDVSWRIGEWNSVDGAILCCAREVAHGAFETVVSPAGGRLFAAALSASRAADGDAGFWASAASANAYAAQVAEDASQLAERLVSSCNSFHNVAAGAASVRLAEEVAAAARTAAAAEAVAHAASVAAARNTCPVDSVSDPYFSTFSAFTTFPVDEHYRAQNAVLAELIEQAKASS